MYTTGCFLTRLAALLGIALGLLAQQSADAASGPDAAAIPQAVVLLAGRSVVERRLPAFMQIQPGRFVAARAVMNACWTPRLNPDSLLLYLPDSQRCQQLSRQDQASLPHRLQQLGGRWLTHDLQASLLNQPFLAIAPANHSADQATATCGCLNNMRPDGVSTCAAQVEFLASDVDSTSLSGQFTYQYDSDPIQVGLPSPLTSSCAPGSGTLQCTVGGLAPAPAGILKLNLTVSDGNSTLPLSTLLEVLAVGDRVFADGFEPPGCF
jgi:hypothetical protein